MIIDFVDVLGRGIRNDTGILGKAFIFNVIISEEYNFDCILFVHETEKPFISLHEDDKANNKEEIMKAIFEKYTLTQLLEV